MKKILIPIDTKFNNYEAIDYAIDFFKREPCDFYFLNTYTYDVDGLDAIRLLQASDDFFERPKRDSMDSLGNVIQKYAISGKNKNHRFNAISECTGMIEGIKKTVDEVDIDLVLIPGKKELRGTAHSYSKNTKKIIEHIRECPVMIIPQAAHMVKRPEFALVSNFEVEFPKTEIENWLELVNIVKGTIKLVCLTGKAKMTPLQMDNQHQVRLQIEALLDVSVGLEYLETEKDLKQFADAHSEYIICLMDRKPDLWRKFGFGRSKITALGPLENSPLIALHR